MSMVVVDRIEGKQAVLSPLVGGPPFDCPLAWLPEGVAEGATLRLARVATRGVLGVAKADEAGVVLDLPDGSTLGLRPELLPPGICEGESLAFVEAPDVEAERRRRLAQTLEWLADEDDGDIEL